MSAGAYLKSNDTWILRGDPRRGDVVLRPTPFGIRMISQPGSYMNKYLPRRGFSWLKSGDIKDLSPPSSNVTMPRVKSDN
jgi:hypothetical protein